MHLPTHALASWLVAEALPLTRRQRMAVLAAGLIPDLDALSLAFGVEAYQRWHHTLLHNGLAALALSLGLAWWSTRAQAPGAPPGGARPAHEQGRPFLEAALVCLASLHLHFLCDLAGSAGPDGSPWTIPYLLPFSTRELSWAGQWPLAGWQNLSLTIGLLLANAAVARRRGRTLLEVVSARADAAVVEVLRRRWPVL